MGGEGGGGRQEGGFLPMREGRGLVNGKVVYVMDGGKSGREGRGEIFHQKVFFLRLTHSSV